MARRRWCHFELRAASLVKHESCLWSLSLHDEGHAITFDAARLKLQGDRPPLTSPDQLAKEFRQGAALGTLTFPEVCDADLVVELYTRVFIRAFNTYRSYDCNGQIFYDGLGWGTEHVPTLIAALSSTRRRSASPRA
jgi:hypothetical protein